MEDQLGDVVRAFRRLALDDPTVAAQVLALMEGTAAAGPPVSQLEVGPGVAPGSGGVSSTETTPPPVGITPERRRGVVSRGWDAVAATVRVHRLAVGLAAGAVIVVAVVARWRSKAMSEALVLFATVVGAGALLVLISAAYVFVLLAWLVTDARRTVALRWSRRTGKGTSPEPESGPLAPGGRGALPVPLPHAVHPFPPLIPDHRARSVLGAVVGRRVANGPVDVERLVADVARGRPVQDIPRRQRLSTAVGVQVLVDRGPAMAPFRSDVDDVVGRVVRLLPDDTCVVVEFEGSPLDRVLAITDGEEGHVPYAPAFLPAPGSTVLVLCELGIGRPATGPRSARPTEWLRLHEEVAQRGCRTVFLVPYGPARWPAALRAAGATVLWWDRRGTERWAWAP